MANKTISKAIIGLMTVTLLLVAMAPVEGGFDEHGVVAPGVLVAGYTISDTTTDSNARIAVTFDIDGTPEEVGVVRLSHTIGAVTTFEEIGVVFPERDGGITKTVHFQASEVLGADHKKGEDVTVDLTVTIAGDIWTAQENIDVDDYTGYVEIENENDGSDEYNPIEDYEIRDQDGDKKINPGDTLSITFDLEGDTNYQDMVISAWAIDGIGAWAQTEPVESREFDLDENQEKDNIELKLEIPDYVSDAAKEYDLYVWFDSDYISLYTVYELTIELEEDSLAIRNVEISDTTVDAGNSITISARVYNDGEDEQEDVTITAEIEELRIKVEDFDTLGNLYTGDYEEWLATIGVPSSADAGTYDLVITAESKDAKDVETIKITVAGGVAPKETDLYVEDEDTKDLGSDGTVDFTLEIENNGETRQVYDLDTEGADAKLSQSKITVEAGETATFTVTVEEAGDVTVYATSDDEIVYETVTANAKDSAVNKDEIIKVLQWIFAVIIIIAIILVIVWAVTKGRNNGEGKKEAYY